MELELRKLILENEGDRDDIYSDVLAYLKSNKDEVILLPKRLTAENGAKDLLRGEFHEQFEHDNGIDSVPVSWDTIKDIYKKIVSHYCA